MQKQFIARLKEKLTEYAKALDLLKSGALGLEAHNLKELKEAEQRIAGDIIAIQKALTPLLHAMTAEERESLHRLYRDIRERLFSTKKALTLERQKTNLDLDGLRRIRREMGEPSRSPESGRESALFIDILS